MVVVNNFTNVNKKNNHLSPQINEHKKTMTKTSGIGIRSPEFGRAYRCGGVKSVNTISTISLVIIVSLTAQHR